MKKAPNLKHQPRDKMTEVIIFAGSDAWAHAKQWQEQDGRLAGDNVPPVWLGEQQLPSPFSTTEGEREKYLPVEEAGTVAAVDS